MSRKEIERFLEPSERWKTRLEHGWTEDARTTLARQVSRRGIEGAPEVVVEILSPSTRGQDTVQKRAVYARFGVGEYWVVDPEDRSIEILVLEANLYRTHERATTDGVLRSPAFPKLAIPLAPLFAPH